METHKCYLHGHKWTFVSVVQQSDGSRYSLTRCMDCGAECRSYDNGNVVESIFRQD